MLEMMHMRLRSLIRRRKLLSQTNKAVTGYRVSKPSICNEKYIPLEYRAVKPNGFLILTEIASFCALPSRLLAIEQRLLFLVYLGIW